LRAAEERGPASCRSLVLNITREEFFNTICQDPTFAWPQVATLEGSSWRTAIECRPLVVFSACAMLFRFANAPLLPLYREGRSGQTTVAANGVTGGASQRLVLCRSGTETVS
jgi:hypothetical protein